MFREENKSMCPVCRCICIGEEKLHRHIEEKHNNMSGGDTELMEKTSGKEVLNEFDSD